MPDQSQTEKSRACTNCAQAKVKCVWPTICDGNAENICLRCANNTLTCSVVHLGTKRKRGKAAHTKILEQKIDDIMSLLSRDREQAMQRSVVQNPTILATSTPPTTIATSSDVDQPEIQFSTDSSSSQPCKDIIAISPGFNISFDVADGVIREYINEMVPRFPFVPLHLCKAEYMNRKAPFLLKTILWACRPPVSNAASSFEQWFRQEVAQQTVVLANKSLEILQALLVFLAWNPLEFYSSSRDTSLLQIAVGLVTDLKLAKWPDKSDASSRSLTEDAAHLRNQVAPKQHTGDGYRAALGVYYIGSVLSSLLDRPTPLKFTQCLDQCCQNMLVNPEHPTDTLLVNLVGMQKIGNKVDDTFRQNDEPLSKLTIGNIHALVIATIHKELDIFMNLLPEHLNWNYLLRSQYTAIKIRLFEPAIHSQGSTTLEHPHIRLKTLGDCLNSTKSLIEMFIAMPIEAYPPMTFIPLLHLALAIIKATQLLQLEDKEWDLAVARASCDLGDLLLRLSEQFKAAGCVGQPRCTIRTNGRPVFEVHAENFKVMHRLYLAKLSSERSYAGPMSMEAAFAPAITHQEQQESFEFWKQLSDFTYGVL